MGQKITSRMIAVGAVCTVSLLGGCVTSMHGYSGVDNEGKREYLTYAASKTPVCMTLSGAAFVDTHAKASEVTAAAAEYASGAILGSSARFTADCASTAHPEYRIVILANAAIVGSPDQLCEEDAVPTRQTVGKLRLDAAFCAKSEPLSTAWSEAPAPAGASDPVFRRMIRTMMNELFPIERDRDRDRENLRLSNF
ncbi:hypothetical protein [Nisaea nitritireducens]|uniref:hypothetical protein n=1 Tax=Nisaea nitritireducens TaxID=568392 RepID=UPI0018692074|nr:hypothetical protein [Nisaea nitritireducens]